MVAAIEILPVPSNGVAVATTSPVSAIVLAVAKAVAVSTLPVTFPVTFPIKGPLKDVAVRIPVTSAPSLVVSSLLVLLK